MKLYHPVWTIKDPSEMLRAIGKLEKTDIDYTLLTESVIGIRPGDLWSPNDQDRPGPMGTGW